MCIRVCCPVIYFPCESNVINFLSVVEVDEFSPYEYVIDNIPESDTEEWKNLKEVMKTAQR